MRREMLVQPLDDQLLGSAVCLRHQVEIALQFEADVPLEIAVNQGSGFAGDFLANFQVRRHKGCKRILR